MTHLLLDSPASQKSGARSRSDTYARGRERDAQRALGHDDIPALARLLAAAEAVDRTGEHYNEADLAEEFANPDIELGKDIVGAFDGDELVGYFSVYPRSTDGSHHKFHVEGTVAPRAPRPGDRHGARPRRCSPGPTRCTASGTPTCPPGSA